MSDQAQGSPPIPAVPCEDPLDRVLNRAFGRGREGHPRSRSDRSVLEFIRERLGPRPPLPRPADASEPLPTTDSGLLEESVPPASGGRYRVVGAIAHGGVGAVFHGRDVELDRPVAIKVLRQQHARNQAMAARFLDEARIEGQLQHPGIVPVHEVGCLADRRPFFTMRLVEGETLAALLARRDPSAAARRRLLAVFAKVLETVAYAHAQGVIHRDLKPANIMVGAFGEVQVMDWGLSKALRAAPTPAAESAPAPPPDESTPPAAEAAPAPASPASSGPRSETGSVMGTPAYMPPEQARGEVDQLDERSDVFALGAILCEILTGQPPFTGASAREIRERAARADLDDARARLAAAPADRELIALATRCLAADPAARPRHAGEVADAFAANLASLDERARAAEIAAAEARVKVAAERRARRLTLALAAAILLALLAAGAAYLWLDAARRARVAENTRAANGALAEAASLRGQARGAAIGNLVPWVQALEAARGAALLARPGAVDPDTHTRAAALLAEVEAEHDVARAAAAQAAKDRAMVERLDEIRLRAAEFWDTAGDYEAPTEAAYAAAFRDYGLDVDATAPEETAARIRATAICAPLVGAIDEWTAVRKRQAQRGKRTPASAPDWERLHAIAQAADADPVCRRARDAAHARDLPALQALVREANTETWSIATLDLIGGGLVGAGDPAQAIAFLSDVRRRHPHDFWIHYNLGLFLFRMKPPRLHEAARCLEAAVALRPDSAAARTSLASVLQHTGELGDAERVCRDALRIAPQFAGAHHALGIVLQQMGRLSEGRASLEEAIRIQPGSLVSRAALAELLRVSGDLPEALAQVNAVIQLAPDQAGFRFELGWILQDLEKLVEAETAYRKAIELEPSHADAHVQLGCMLQKLGKPEEARAEWESALVIDPGHPAAHVNLGVVFFKQGQVAKAESAFHRAIASNPRYAGAYQELGILLAGRGDHEGAAAAFREALSLEPDNVKMLVYLGRTLLRLGDPREGVTLIERALRLRPDDCEALNALAVIFHQRGDAARALGYAKEAARAAPQRSTARSNYGAAMARNGQLDAAIAEFRAAIELDSRNVSALAHLGDCHELKKQWPEAAEAFRAALEMRPDFPGAQASLGTALRAMGDRAGARRAFEAAVTLDPRDVAAQVSLAKVLVREGEIDRAITIYQTAIELQPDSPDAWHHLGVACMSTGRAAEGARAFGEVARLRPENAVVRRDYGIALSRCGRLGEAVGELEAAVKLAPTLAPAQKELEELRRMAALEPQLSAILGSKDDRVAPAVRRDLARLCSWKNLPAAAARFWDAAFASDPRLAEDDGNRYSAACAAALAGCGRGEDAASLNGVERARWRAQALAWLRANVAAIAARAESARDEHRAALVASLVHFKRDPDLEALRDPRFTALLPDSESRACAALWREANRLLATLQSKR